MKRVTVIKYTSATIITLSVFCCKVKDLPSEALSFSKNDIGSYLEVLGISKERAILAQAKHLDSDFVDQMISFEKFNDTENYIKLEVFDSLQKYDYGILVKEHLGEATCIFDVILARFSNDTLQWNGIRWNEGCGEPKKRQLQQTPIQDLTESLAAFCERSEWQPSGRTTFITIFRKDRMRSWYLEMSSQEKEELEKIIKFRF